MIDPSFHLAIQEVVRLGLKEDAPWGDVTTNALVPETATSTALLTAREPGIMTGGDILFEAFPDCTVKINVADSKSFQKDETLATISGPSRIILLGERIALNLLQRMCGIATLTSQYVNEVAGTNARIVDTRKTTPGLRFLEKYAVSCGGGVNHRFSLSDAVLVKDNHLVTAGADLTKTLQRMASELPHTIHIEVEVDAIDQIEAVLDSGVVDTIMLDNFSIEDLKTAVQLINKQTRIEASGGVNLQTVRAIAETGVDLISVGSLTHSARALDLGLDFTNSSTN